MGEVRQGEVRQGGGEAGGGEAGPYGGRRAGARKSRFFFILFLLHHSKESIKNKRVK